MECHEAPILVFAFCLIFALSKAIPPDKHYRSDYVYNRQTDAFYKIHIEETFNHGAAVTCSLEGATLMVPSTREDLIQAHAMMKSFPDIGDYFWIGADGKEHESVEEQPIINLHAESSEYEYVSPCDILTRRGEIESASCYHRRPFICKVAANDAIYDSQCHVYSSAYQYYSSVGSCYKVSDVPLTWDQAYAECRAEGAHLVVLNSEAEHQAVWDIIRAAPRAIGVQAFFFFFAGIRANRPTDGTPRVFRTVFNETLQEAGYSEWSEGEPNNYQDTEYCGTIFLNNGKYNDVECAHLYQFVCEKEVHAATH
ncbi:macrophage mannose receptor 1-like [Pectinophora gossypiella]|uniref:macrophage mannose receptor 1-like n=1 Tax=Pectinophora gossypiella TaxID=13191 RepID=UPI00214E53B6|nr:macrophage mannose receptor 1-like [Pectinophora gossypiella]